MSIDELKALAANEDWEKVDETLPTVCNDPAYVEWATYTGLTDPNDDIRDVAASLLEQSTAWTPKTKQKLAERLSDNHLYARFRAACAIANHDTAFSVETVKNVLYEIADRKTEEQDLRDHANMYLGKYD